MKRIVPIRKRAALLLLMFVVGLPSAAQAATFQIVASLPNEARNPIALVASGNVLFGKTYQGGDFQHGSVYSIQTDGSNFQTLHSFATAVSPSGLVADGTKLYGSTNFGGATGNGFVYSMDTDGNNFADLRDFTSADPSPHNLTQLGSNLYGLASYSTLFSIGKDGTNYQPLHSFGAGPSNGGMPSGIVAIGGKILGTLETGGAFGAGGIYSIQPNGSNFQLFFSSNSLPPTGNLISVGGLLYGVTVSNGQVSAIFSVNPDGTNATPLHITLGDVSTAATSLTAVGNVLYGVDGHSVFSMNLDGSNFQVIQGGLSPASPLVLVGSTLYGVTNAGGTAGQGFLYAIAVPEPGTLGMLALALLGLVLTRRVCR